MASLATNGNQKLSSNYFLSTFVDSSNIFDCRQSCVIEAGQCKDVAMIKFPYTFLTFCMLGNFAFLSSAF